MSASNTFINQAVGIVTDAINADKDGEYEKALGLYKRSLDYFMKGLEYEKNKSARVRLFPPRLERDSHARTFAVRPHTRFVISHVCPAYLPSPARSTRVRRRRAPPSCSATSVPCDL